MVSRSAVLATVLGLGLAAAPAAQAKACQVSPSEKFGVTYVTSLSVAGVTCARGKEVVRAFHRCRKDNGGIMGRCSRVLGYRCTERRTSNPAQFSSKATCTNGTRRIVHTYTQNT